VIGLLGRLRGPRELPTVEVLDATTRVRENSRGVWNEWVGNARFRERVAYGFAGVFAVVVLCESIALVKEAGKPLIPPAIITVDGYGQVRDVRRPVATQMDDRVLKYFLATYVSAIFATVNSASALSAQYQRARFMTLPGSAADMSINGFWDRFSPLRKMRDGTLQIPVAPRQNVGIHVTSYLPDGQTTDGADAWELQWTAQPIGLDGVTGLPTLYRGRLAFKRSAAPPAWVKPEQLDDYFIANPFGIAVEELQWDTVR
jgi:type IV secretory pathway TrbF-like protein